MITIVIAAFIIVPLRRILCGPNNNWEAGGTDMPNMHKGDTDGDGGNGDDGGVMVLVMVMLMMVMVMMVMMVTGPSLPSPLLPPRASLAPRSTVGRGSLR